MRKRHKIDGVWRRSKTGNRLALKANNQQAGKNKVLVIYTKSGGEQDKTKWVTHKCHLDDVEAEKAGFGRLQEFLPDGGAQEKKCVKEGALVLY